MIWNVLKKLLSRLNYVEEYEKMPIPEKNLKGWKSIIGMYTPEHTTVTEFEIGPLLVAQRVTASELLRDYFLEICWLFTLISTLFFNLYLGTISSFVTAPLRMKKTN